MSQQNEHWPLISTVAANGYAGVQINPRWATNIYYNVASTSNTLLNILTFPSATFLPVLFLNG